MNEEFRELTKEEREKSNKYIKQISTKTGLNFFDLIKKEDKNAQWKV